MSKPPVQQILVFLFKKWGYFLKQTRHARPYVKFTFTPTNNNTHLNEHVNDTFQLNISTIPHISETQLPTLTNISPINTHSPKFFELNMPENHYLNR